MKNLVPIATVATERTYKEFLLLKKSAEQYHDIFWYVSADKYVYNKLKDQKNLKVWQLIETDDCNHNSTDLVQRKNFLNLVLTKFDVCEFAITNQRLEGSAYDGVLFLDSDVFFVNPLEEASLDLMKNRTLDMILSLHMTNNFQNEAFHGLYNVGMFYVRNQDALKVWKHMSANHEQLGMYYEQGPLTYLSRMYWCGQFPINYNISWWRMNEPSTKSRLDALKIGNNGEILFGEKPAVNIHVHTLKTQGVVQHGQFLLDKILSLMENSGNDKYQDFLKYYEEIK